MSSESMTVREALDYWGAHDVDHPIAIVPFPCGRFVCPNHDVERGESLFVCEPPVA